MKKILIIASSVLLAICFIALIAMDLPTLTRQQTINVDYNGNNIVMTLYKGEDKGVLMLGGFSSDQQSLFPLAKVFNDNGYSVLTLDYTGHGRSGGKVGFDNATNGEIPKQLALALETFKEKTNLKNEDIILFGHSMGGRAIVEYLIGNPTDFGGIVLVGPQINYSNNTQSSLFTGVNDGEIAPWNTLGDEKITNTKIHILGSTWDDIATTSSLEVLNERLSKLHETEYIVNNGIFHSYEVWSPSFLKDFSDVFNEIDGQPLIKQYTLALRIVSWFVIVISAFVLFTILGKAEKQSNFKLVDYRQFVKSKLKLWLLSIVIAVVLMCLVVVIPTGSPVLNLILIVFLTGYGFMSLIKYSKNKLKGVEVLKLEEEQVKVNWWKFVAVFIPSGVALVVFLRSGLYHIYPWNIRLMWLAIFTVIMAVHFYISNKEEAMLVDCNRKQKLLYNVIQYIPMILMIVAYLCMASFTGLVGLIQNFVFLLLAVKIGDTISKYSNSRVAGAICASLLFQSVIMNATAIIGIF